MLLTNLRNASTVISPDRGRVLSFDREGRLLTYYRRGETFKRSLGNDVHLTVREDGSRRRRRLEPAHGEEILSEACCLAGESRNLAEPAVTRRIEQEILPWTEEKRAEEAAFFKSVYRPISILPPDCYRTIVLQITEGCTWNRCTFCSFYADRPFAVKTPAAVYDHAQHVKEFLGRGLLLRKGIFLADGNALAIATGNLAEMMERATVVFPEQPFYGFIDLYAGEKKGAMQWRELAEKGLSRVHIGMETGSDRLLAWINKPGSRAELIDFVETLKQAELNVALISMVGIGGRPWRDQHAQATLAALAKMPLGRQDLVYLSPFVETAGSEYETRRQKENLCPMNEQEIGVELERLAAEIRSLGVPATRYDIREFIY